MSRLSETLNQMRNVEAGLLRVAEAMHRKAKQYAPVETGYLRDNITIRRDDDLTVVVESKAPYSGFVEYGTRPHVITPKRRRALRFEVDGRVVFATRVYHPGTSPRPFFQPAFDWVLERAATLLDPRRRR